MSRRVPHLHRTYNGAYDPWAVRVDLRWTCSVCSFRGIDPETWQEPEQEVISYTVEGTYTHPAAGTPLEELDHEPVFFGDTTPPSGAPACTSSNVAVFFGDTTPSCGAPMHTIDNHPVYFQTPGAFLQSPLYATGTVRHVTAEVGTRAGCPMCHSPNWAWGSASDLLW